jgi:chromosome segregation ATPase
MESIESDHPGAIESDAEALMVASKNIMALPSTPEQAHVHKSRTHDGAGYTPDDVTPMTASTMRTTTPATTVNIPTINWNDTDPIRILDVEYSLASTDQEGAPRSDATAATHSETGALEEMIANLRQELARQSCEYTTKLDAEHAWCQSTVQQASEVACILRDANVQLTAEVEQLRSRVGQLEVEAAEQSAAMDSAFNEDEQQGNEQLIAALQVEIGDLQRQLHKAHRARVAAAETEEAALQRAEILQQQVEQMVNLLEIERIEKEKIVEALKAASVLPPEI